MNILRKIIFILAAWGWGVSAFSGIQVKGTTWTVVEQGCALLRGDKHFPILYDPDWISFNNWDVQKVHFIDHLHYEAEFIKGSVQLVEGSIYRIFNYETTPEQFIRLYEKNSQYHMRFKLEITPAGRLFWIEPDRSSQNVCDSDEVYVFHFAKTAG